MRIRRAKPVEAKAQSGWIVAIEPWLSLGYKGPPLGRYLARMARAGQVLVAVDRTGVLGVCVWQPDFLLGQFIALLAVRPEAAGKGIGRAMVARLEEAHTRIGLFIFVAPGRRSH